MDSQRQLDYTGSQGVGKNLGEAGYTLIPLPGPLACCIPGYPLVSPQNSRDHTAPSFDTVPEAEEGRSLWVPGQPHSETVSKKTQKTGDDGGGRLKRAFSCSLLRLLQPQGV